MPIPSKWILVLAAGLASGAHVLSCGGSESPSSTQTGGAGSTAVGSGGVANAGGASGAGGSESVLGGQAGDRPSGSGGSSAKDASVDLSFCFEDGGRLVASARACTMDSDCGILVARRCCGADGATGILKSEQMTFAPCFALPSNACMGLGCAKFFGYTTDTGRTTEYDVSVKNLLDLVAVHCTANVCTTDVAPHTDAGHD